MNGLLTRRLTETRGEAPYSDYPAGIYQTVFAAISKAWQMLIDEEAEALPSFGEVDTTACLQMLLEDLRCAAEPVVRGFTSGLFETVHRDSSLLSCDGRSLEKQPDLTFRLINRHPGMKYSLFRAIFVECKLVEPPSKPVRLYCTEGIRRFINGQYAWAMPSGVMVAYARAGCSVLRDLEPFLSSRQDAGEDPFLTRSLPRLWNLGSSSTDVYSSTHGRRCGRNGWLGEIQLHHLWLSP